MLLPYTASLGSLVVSIVASEAKGYMFEPYDGHFLIIEERGGWEIISESKINLICSGYVALEFVFHKLVKRDLRGFRPLWRHMRLWRKVEGAKGWEVNNIFCRFRAVITRFRVRKRVLGRVRGRVSYIIGIVMVQKCILQT